MLSEGAKFLVLALAPAIEHTGQTFCKTGFHLCKLRDRLLAWARPPKPPNIDELVGIGPYWEELIPSSWQAPNPATHPEHHADE
jgi:hypothetical protein